jgi:hypothetical protein
MSISLDRSLRALLALLAAAVLALGAAACGSDDDSGAGGGSGDAAESSDSEPLSKPEYEQQLNKAQTDFAAKAGKLDLANPSSPKDFKNSLDKLVVLIDDLTQRLEKFEPPEQVGSQHDELVGLLEGYGETIEAEKGGLDSDEQKEVVDAADKLGKASTTFSANFSKTVNQINKRLE